MPIINMVYKKHKQRATQWPCPRGFHVPLYSEWSNVCSVLTSSLWLANRGVTIMTYLKMPYWWMRYRGDSGVLVQWQNWLYWSSSRYNDANAYIIYFNSSDLYPTYNNQRANWYLVRPFKNIPVQPDSSRTVLKQWTWDAGVYHNSTLWLISISGDGTTWITIADKNLWATQVYNVNDTLNEAKCGKYYQRWNNYGFPYSWSVTTSSTKVDASTYWPWNYYSSSTFITVSSSPYRWDTTDNANLWWWEDGNVPV